MVERATTTVVTVSLPNQTLADVRSVAGKRGVSKYVADAVRRQLVLDGLGEIVEEFEATHPPLQEAEVAAAAQRLFQGGAREVAA